MPYTFYSCLQIVACLEKGQNKERMEAAYETLDEELKTRWVEFVTNSLNPSLKEQNDELGGPLGNFPHVAKLPLGLGCVVLNV